MGHELGTSNFTAQDHRAFDTRLREETRTLKGWFEDRVFHEASTSTVGLELEAWLVGADHRPAPRNAAFLALIDDPLIVPELSRYNFEINADPEDLFGAVFSHKSAALDRIWARCQAAANTLGLHPVAVGILPTVSEEMLNPDWMSASNRFAAINQELMMRRGGQPISIAIAGAQDRLDCTFDHIMLEAACTSLQAHLKINQDEAVRLYNASIIAAAPLVAATANAPFLYGRSLWAETRIPAFEQSTALEGFRTLQSRNVLRVTLGTDYLKESLFELFEQNLRYPRLLPDLEDEDGLAHLRLQNGTVWRWVRPILGFGPGEVPHLRIEMRVMPAGPSTVDMVANLALYFGLALSLGRAEDPPEHDIPFQHARANFYACARDGLGARLRWKGRDVAVRDLLLDELIPQAHNALEREGVDRTDLNGVFNGILRPRVSLGLNGAQWQRQFVNYNGHDMAALTERYAALQAGGTPVHTWPFQT